MTKLAIAMLAVGLFSTPSAHAFDSVTEPTAFAYFKLPMGASTRRTKAAVFGVRIDQSRAEPGRAIELRNVARHPALMDFQVGRHGLHAWTVRGQDMLAASGALSAKSGEAEAKGPPVAGVLVGVAVTAFVVTNAAD